MVIRRQSESINILASCLPDTLFNTFITIFKAFRCRQERGLVLDVVSVGVV